jgi:hypothetical protein
MICDLFLNWFLLRHNPPPLHLNLVVQQNQVQVLFAIDFTPRINPPISKMKNANEPKKPIEL